ncbi:MAG: hypothetical protein ACJAVL_000188 [Bacteroidia bacterium]
MNLKPCKNLIVLAECMSFPQNPVDKNQVAVMVGYIPLLQQANITLK